MNNDILHHLQERVKELTLLHRAARLLQDDEKPVEEIIRQIVNSIPPAWQYPEVTAARITYKDLDLRTHNFSFTDWRQKTGFFAKNGEKGVIEVCYLEVKPSSFEGPFLKEERDLIESLAEMLRAYFQHKNDNYAVRMAQENLELQVRERTSELAAANQALKKEIEKHLEARQKIEQYQRQLQNLASKLSLTEENERREIASDLHDHLGQALAFIKIKVEEFRGNSIFSGQNESIEQIIALLEQTIRYTRSLTFEISQPLLYELGVAAAVEWLAESFQKKYNLTIKVRNSADFSAVPIQLQILFYKSIRELLVNIAKHSGASQALIEMRLVSNFFQITVEDNGNGFDKKILDAVIDDQKGFGLFSISERFRYFSGSMTIDTALDKGTRITLKLPINAN